MTCKSSLDGKSKHSDTDRSASDSRWSKAKKRRRSQVCQVEPQQSDSTIATVTLVIGGGGAGEGVKIVKNAAAADIAVDCADMADLDSLAVEGHQQQRKPRHRKEDRPVEISSVLPDKRSTKRKSNERLSPAKSGSYDGATLAMYDLEDQENLPAEVLDILSCKGGPLCFHDHDRFNLINNKVYVYKKSNGHGKYTGKRPTSPTKQNPRLSSRTKKVTFSPVNKRQSPHKSRERRQRLVCPRRKLKSAACQTVPPPPSGYHIRIDPSSVDSYCVNSASDDSILSQTDRETVSRLTNSLKQEPIDSMSKPTHTKQNASRKEIKDRVRTSAGATARRFARAAKDKGKKRRFDSNHLSTTENCKRKQNLSPVEDEIAAYGAYGDTICKDTPCQKNVFDFYKKHFYTGEKQDHACTENVNEDANLELAGVSSNKRYSAHTIWVEKDASMNNNNYSKPGMPSEWNKRCVDIGATPSIPSNLSYSFHLHSLNINMNAMSYIGYDPANVPDDHQEVPLEQNLSSTTPSVDHFYTPETVSASGPPEVISEDSPAEAEGSQELCERPLEEVLPKLETQPLDSPTSVVCKTQEQEIYVGSEQECWESKKHSIMVACNEAIKSRLQRQEVEEEEEESQEITTSESASANSSREKKKKRKTKTTTESVYVKVKTSLSKKMTTTTTVKEIKLPSQDTPEKAMMVENDHHTILSLPSQNSEKCLVVPQPRHTRIIKCGEAESHVRKRKLSSDTEVELLHATESSKQTTGASKDAKDCIIRDRQINKKENTYVETPMVEVHYVDVDRQDISQRSPHQNLSLGNGELIGECDKLSEKASAITVINVMENQNEYSKIEDILSHEKNEEELSSKENILEEENLLLACPTAPFTIEADTNNEKAKRKSKSSKRDKKKSELKRLISIAKKSAEMASIHEAPQGPQSETSLAHSSKKTTSSTSKATRSTIRSHSSPPASRKKKMVSKKKGSVHLLDSLETSSKGSHKARKKSPDKRKKTKTSTSREEKPIKTGSNSSTNSEKKRKSQTTASSISIDSEKEGQESTEKAMCEHVIVPSEIKVPLSTTEAESFGQHLDSQEDVQTLVGQKEDPSKLGTQNTTPQEKLIEQTDEVRAVDNCKVNEEKICDAISKQNENISKPKIELPGHPPAEAMSASKAVKKPTAKGANTRALINKQPKEKNLQKAEEGWDCSTTCPGERGTKVGGPKAKYTHRKTKLKYVLVKAKDKDKESNTDRAKKVQDNRIKNDTKTPCEASSDQDGQGDTSLRGQAKTVQFSESIEKMDNVKHADMHGEVETSEEQAQENHLGDNASDGTLGDMFITNNFDLVRELEEEAEAIQGQSMQREPAPRVESIAQSDKQKKRNRRPMWLKKAVPKTLEDPFILETRVVTSKQNLSPKRLEKRKESLEEILLKSNKCNIEVTNPLPATGMCPKREVPSVKPKVAYSSMLSNVFRSLPLKKRAKRVIAEAGSPVDIKEVTEGSSVDASDYAKNLRYSPNTKRISGVFSAGPGRRKESLELRAHSPTDLLIGSSSARSLLSRDSDADYGFTSANCSFSTDLDEAPVYRRVQTRALSKKEPRTASGRRASNVLPWHLMGGGSSPGNREPSDMSYLRVAGDMAEPGILNVGLSWLMQEFFNRFNFLNPRRHLRPLSLRQASEISIDPPSQEQQVFAAV